MATEGATMATATLKAPAQPAEPATGPAPVALGIDIGGTKVAAALVDDHGRVLAHERGPVAPDDNATGLASIFAVVDRLLAAAPEVRARLRGIGAGAPGAIDWQAGTLLGAANLAWRHLPIAAALTERYHLPALLENDVNVAAWGEFSFGTESGASSHSAAAAPSHSAQPSGALEPADLVFLAAGTGIGAGIVAHGRLLRGRGRAGEIGHIPLFEDGPPCRCGATGCLEAVASGPALAAAARRAATTGGAPAILALAGGAPESITADLVVQAATGGDPAAAGLLDREGYYLALAVLIVARLLDPARIVLGGGLAAAGAPLFEAIWRHLARLRPRAGAPWPIVSPPKLGPEAGAAGAAALILRPEPGFVEAGLLPATG